MFKVFQSNAYFMKITQTSLIKHMYFTRSSFIKNISLKRVPWKYFKPVKFHVKYFINSWFHETFVTQTSFIKIIPLNRVSWNIFISNEFHEIYFTQSISSEIFHSIKVSWKNFTQTSFMKLCCSKLFLQNYFIQTSLMNILSVSQIHAKYVTQSRFHVTVQLKTVSWK